MRNSHCKLLALPLEIRSIIYDIVLFKAKDATHLQLPDPPNFFVCSQTYKETIKLYRHQSETLKIAFTKDIIARQEYVQSVIKAATTLLNSVPTSSNTMQTMKKSLVLMKLMASASESIAMAAHILGNAIRAEKSNFRELMNGLRVKQSVDGTSES